MKMNDLAAMLLQTQRPLTITLLLGTGEGATPQAALDVALIDTGAAGCHRLRESSLIPANARIVCAKPTAAPRANARVQYVVMSQMQQSRPGEHAHAGLAWVQRADGGRGLFIDLHDGDRDRLEHDLLAAFGAIASLRNPAYGPVQTAIASRRCDGLPVCALVVAACACDPW
jgi:pyruvoyl-dependent arginine decarboxylase (PvlArgDC)